MKGAGLIAIFVLQCLTKSAQCISCKATVPTSFGEMDEIDQVCPSSVSYCYSLELESSDLTLRGCLEDESITMIMSCASSQCSMTSVQGVRACCCNTDSCNAAPGEVTDKIEPITTEIPDLGSGSGDQESGDGNQESGDGTPSEVNCPEGWTPHNGHCYRTHDECSSSQSFAASTCLREGAHLMSIDSKDELDHITKNFGLNSQWWTSGQKTQTGSWAWAEGSGEMRQLSYSAWNYGEPNDLSGTETSITLQYQRYSSSWGLNDGDPKLLWPFVCEAESANSVKTGCDSSPCLNGGSCVESSGGDSSVSAISTSCTCASGFSGLTCELKDSDPWFPYKGHSYKLFADCGKSRKDADLTCRQYGAYLVSFAAEKEMDFVEYLLKKEGYENNHFYWWTGGKRSSNGWIWEELSQDIDVNYSKWGDYEPNNYLGAEDYIQLRWYADKDGWVWNDMRESRQNAYICERDSW